MSAFSCRYLSISDLSRFVWSSSALIDLRKKSLTMPNCMLGEEARVRTTNRGGIKCWLSITDNISATFNKQWNDYFKMVYESVVLIVSPVQAEQYSRWPQTAKSEARGQGSGPRSSCMSQLLGWGLLFPCNVWVSPHAGPSSCISEGCQGETDAVGTWPEHGLCHKQGSPRRAWE